MDNRVIKILKNPALLFMTFGHRGLFNWMSDEAYLKIAYRARTGKKLRLAPPITFNEKIQWLKLHDHKPEYSRMVDKYEAKKYVADHIGDEYIIPTYGVWNNFADIDFDLLPGQFVLKCTHDSGGVVICRDKNKFDYSTAKKKINNNLRQNFFWGQREWPYKGMRPRIIAEKLMVDESETELKDYKFFCFNGKVRCFKIDFDRFTSHRANYYDSSMVQLHFGESDFPPDYNRELKKPKQFDVMLDIAERLSKGHIFLRVDLYNINGAIYFGELTFYPASGMGSFMPEEWDYTLGEWLELPEAHGEEDNE